MDKSQILQSQGQKILRGAPSPSDRSALSIALGVLHQTAQKLQHSQYFLVTDQRGQWQSVTLENHHAPEQQKTVIYAFGDRTLANIERLQSGNSQDLLCKVYPVIEILFRFLGFMEIDSLVFLEHLTEPNRGIEIKRLDLARLVQQASSTFGQTQVC